MFNRLKACNEFDRFGPGDFETVFSPEESKDALIRGTANVFLLRSNIGGVTLTRAFKDGRG